MHDTKMLRLELRCELLLDHRPREHHLGTMFPERIRVDCLMIFQVWFLIRFIGEITELIRADDQILQPQFIEDFGGSRREGGNAYRARARNQG